MRTRLFHWSLTRSRNAPCHQRSWQETVLGLRYLRELAAPGANLLRKTLVSQRYTRNRLSAGHHLFKNGMLLTLRPNRRGSRNVLISTRPIDHLRYG